MGGGEQAQDLWAGIKAYSINIDTHTSCLAASPDRAPYGHWPVSCLSWVRSEDRMAAASTCSTNVTCLSAVTVHRHTLSAEIWAQRTHSGGQTDTDASSQPQMYILSDKLIFAVFSVDTHDSLGSCFMLVCLRTHLYVHACKLFQICIHKDINTNIFYAINLIILQRVSMCTCPQKYMVQIHILIPSSHTLWFC